MRSICLFFLVATLVSSAMASNRLPPTNGCNKMCALYFSPVCAIRICPDSTLGFDYKDFSNNCALNNENCGIRNPASKYFAITREGMNCQQLGELLSPTMHTMEGATGNV